VYIDLCSGGGTFDYLYRGVGPCFAASSENQICAFPRKRNRRALADAAGPPG